MNGKDLGSDSKFKRKFETVRYSGVSRGMATTVPWALPPLATSAIDGMLQGFTAHPPSPTPRGYQGPSRVEGASASWRRQVKATKSDRIMRACGCQRTQFATCPPQNTGHEMHVGSEGWNQSHKARQQEERLTVSHLGVGKWKSSQIFHSTSSPLRPPLSLQQPASPSLLV